MRVLYVFEGSELGIADETIGGSTAAVVEADRPVPLTAAADGPVEVLVLQGRPIGEPVAQQGPFVMNTEAELHQAFADYRRTEFGGWPFDSEDPNHGPDCRPLRPPRRRPRRTGRPRPRRRLTHTDPPDFCVRICCRSDNIRTQNRLVVGQ